MAYSNQTGLKIMPRTLKNIALTVAMAALLAGCNIPLIPGI